MIRSIALLILTASLAACAQYREPSVNCFSFASMTPDQAECDFVPLGGPDPSEGTLA